MNHLVTITGATGHIGKALTELLLSKRVQVRAIARGAQSLASLGMRGAEGCPGDLADTAFLTESFRRSAAVFAMIPPNYSAQDIRADQRAIAQSLVRALNDAGVPRVVALSSIGAELPSGTGPIAGLHEFEEMLKEVPGISVVVLRAAYFMENLMAAIPLIKSAGMNGGALREDVSLPMIATRDIAAAAANILDDPAFRGFSIRELLGPQDYTMRGATAILGAAIGNSGLAYTQFPYGDFRNALMGAGFSQSVADAFVEMEEAFNSGRIQKGLVRKPSNTTPTTLEEFARDVFAAAFRHEEAMAGAQR